MEHLALLDVSKYWSYDKRRCGEKWWSWRDAAIVRVFPWFNSVPPQEDEKFVEFCWSELVVYMTFHDFKKYVGHMSDEIIQNWEKFQYRPWHVDYNSLSPIEWMQSDDKEEHANPQKDSRQHEWEIIYRLYKNQFINYNEFEMIQCRDCDRLHVRNTNFLDEDTSSRAIHFISWKRKSISNITNQQHKFFSIQSLGVKKRKAFDVIFDHYKLGVDPLCMIIQGTASTRKSYMIGAI